MSLVCSLVGTLVWEFMIRLGFRLRLRGMIMVSVILGLSLDPHVLGMLSAAYVRDCGNLIVFD